MSDEDLHPMRPACLVMTVIGLIAAAVVHFREVPMYLGLEGILVITAAFAVIAWRY